MYGLEIPDALTGRAFHGNKWVGEQIVAEELTAIHVVGRACQRKIRHAQFFVGGHQRPKIRHAGVRRRIFFPAVVARLAWPRDDVEGPAWFARAHVKGLHVAWRLTFDFRAVAHASAGHYDITANLRTAG